METICRLALRRVTSRHLASMHCCVTWRDHHHIVLFLRGSFNGEDAPAPAPRSPRSSLSGPPFAVNASKESIRAPMPMLSVFCTESHARDSMRRLRDAITLGTTKPAG
jgi:hypothetical protein